MSLEKIEHFPVMLEEVLSIITPQHGGTFIDCTFGAGGYSKAILKFPKTKVIALDRDKAANLFANDLIKKHKNRFKFYNKKFSQIDTLLEDNNKTKAIILDLGFSMHQMKDLSRGFSFNSTGSLDMKMGLNSFDANKVINYLDTKKIELILKYFGDEKNSKKIAYKINNFRKKKLLDTADLVKIINGIKRKKYYTKINPSTKSFQALRIFVNNEITELISVLINTTKQMSPGSILIVITFHSIEDKIVKYFFKNYSEAVSNKSRYIPELPNEDKSLFNCPQKKPLMPSDKELLINQPSRSAKLRYVVRNSNKFEYPNDFIKKFKNYIDIENFGLKL